MQVDIRKLSEFSKFIIIKSILKYQKENDWKIIPPEKPLDVKFLVNDKEMDVIDIFDSIEKNLEEYVLDKANELLRDKFYDFESAITDTLDEVISSVESKMLQKIDNNNKKEIKNDD